MLLRWFVITFVYLGVSSLTRATAAGHLSYAAVYEDANCTSSATHFVFSAETSCVPPTSITCLLVGNGSSIYHMNACSTTSEYENVLAAAFSSKLFLAVKTYSDVGNCETLQGVTAYLADNLCHDTGDGNASFQISTSDDGSASLETFSNASCSSNNTERTDFSHAKLTATSCAENANQIFYMGGATSKWTILSLFTDSKCNSKPVNIQVYHRFICDPERHPASGACRKFMGHLYSAWSCADDYTAFTENAFGSGVPFLVKESYYDETTCTELDYLMIYQADGSCISMGWPNYKVKLLAGGTASFTTFSASDCSSNPDTQILDRVTLAAKACVEDANTQFYIGGVTPQWKAIAIYNDNKCNTIPAQVSLTSEFSCEPKASTANSGCVAGGSLLSSSSDCTDDYFAFAAEAFGENHPFVVMEEYEGDGECSVLAIVTVYSADNFCHNSLDGLSSFSAVVHADLSAEIKTYNELDCGGLASSTSVSRTVSQSHSCFEHKKKFYLGGATTKWTAMAVFASNDCGGAPMEMIFTKEFTCTISSTSSCTRAGTSDVFLSHNCVQDYVTFAATMIDGLSYVLLDRYKDGSNCGVLQDAAALAADGKCHVNIDTTTSFLISLEEDGSVTMNLYDDIGCQDTIPEASKYSAADLRLSSCFESKLKLQVHRIVPAPTTAAPTPAPAPSSPNPSPTTTPEPSNLPPEPTIPTAATTPEPSYLPPTTTEMPESSHSAPVSEVPASLSPTETIATPTETPPDTPDAGVLWSPQDVPTSDISTTSAGTSHNLALTNVVTSVLVLMLTLANSDTVH